MYLAGLEKQGIIGGKGNQTATPTGNSGLPGNAKPPPVDYAEDPLLPRGFKTRRAG